MLPSTTRPATVCRLHHVIEEIVADNRSVHFLAEQINDKNISGLQHVDRGLIRQLRNAAVFRLGFGDVFNVRAQRHELHRKRAADHGLARMQHLEAIGILIAKSFLFQDRPHLFRRQSPRSFDQVVGNFGAAVREPIEGILRGVVDQIRLGKVTAIALASAMAASDQRRT